MRPVLDRTSTKYPDRVFYAGAWRTPEQIERVRETNRRFELNNKDKRQPLKREYHHKKYATDPLFRLRMSQRGTLSYSRRSLERRLADANL